MVCTIEINFRIPIYVKHKRNLLQYTEKVPPFVVQSCPSTPHISSQTERSKLPRAFPKQTSLRKPLWSLMAVPYFPSFPMAVVVVFPIISPFDRPALQQFSHRPIHAFGPKCHPHHRRIGPTLSRQAGKIDIIYFHPKRKKLFPSIFLFINIAPIPFMPVLSPWPVALSLAAELFPPAPLPLVLPTGYHPCGKCLGDGKVAQARLTHRCDQCQVMVGASMPPPGTMKVFVG